MKNKNEFENLKTIGDGCGAIGYSLWLIPITIILILIIIAIISA